MKGLAVLVLALRASDAERTPGEVVRFGFPYQSCKADPAVFEDDQSSSRKLELGTGGGCAEGPFGNHLGVVHNESLSGDGTYEPLESAQGDFAAELTDGFTLELWVKPQPLDDTADRVIVSLSARNTESTHAQMQDLNCTQDDVSFQLIMKPSGCLVVYTKLISTEDCLASGAYERGEYSTFPERKSAFKLPHGIDCAINDYSSNRDDPGLDLTTPKLQHVVVSLSAYMGGEAGPGADRGAPANQTGTKRFAVWVDSELKTSDEHGYVFDRLWNTDRLSKGEVVAVKRTDDDYDLTKDKTKNFVPSAIWGADHALRVGFDGTSDSPSFEGEVLWVRVRDS